MSEILVTTVKHESATTDNITLGSNGSVGIGATAPTGKFEVSGGRSWFTANNEPYSLGVRYGAGLGTMYIGATNSATPSMQFSNGGGSALVNIDWNGNVGVGTSSPAAKLAVVGGTSNASNLATAYSLAAFNITPKSTSGYSLQFGSGPADLPYIQMSAGGAAAGNLLIQPYGGNLLVGTTGLPTAGTLGTAFQVGASIAGMATWTQRSSSTAASDHAYFYNPNGIVGFIRTTGSSTAYSTSSDYRLKEDWQPMTGASERVKALNPVNFAWKADGSRVDGFLAHEAAEVVPEAVSGAKDAVDADGNPDYQGIDQSKLVPLLTAALQEALAKIDDLTARLSALETA